MSKKNKYVNLDELNVLSYNPRSIGSDELERLKRSIKEHTKAIPEEERGDEYRLVSTVTINKNGNRIIGGHQRIKALQELGQSSINENDITWVNVEPDSAEEKSLNITLNSDRISGDWDKKKLNELLNSIAIENIDLFDSLSLGNIDIKELNDESLISSCKESKEEIVLKEEDKIVENKYKDSPGTNLTIIGPTEQKNKQNDDIEDQTETEEQLFPISYAVTAEQRKNIIDAIEKSKKINDLETSAEALNQICENYLTD